MDAVVYKSKEAIADKQTDVALLVVAAQSGDREAFSQLVERFQNMVLGIARMKTGDALVAEEVAQEAFVRAYRKLDQLAVPAAFPGWIRSITVRLAINHLTRKSATTATEPALLDVYSARCDSPSEAALRKEQIHSVRAGMQELGELDRRTLEAFYLRGESLAQMSESESAPIGTIKRRLHFARKRLAKQLEPAMAT